MLWILIQRWHVDTFERGHYSRKIVIIENSRPNVTWMLFSPLWQKWPLIHGQTAPNLLIKCLDRWTGELAGNPSNAKVKVVAVVPSCSWATWQPGKEGVISTVTVAQCKHTPSILVLVLVHLDSALAHWSELHGLLIALWRWERVDYIKGSTITGRVVWIL